MHGGHEVSEAAPPIRLLANKYRLIRELGRGAMGAVWQAEHLTLHSLVAIKLLDAEIAADAQALQRFLGEARAAAALRSPHVVQVLDHGVFEGTPYIVMEQLEGESLADRLDARGQLSPRETARIVTHIARALARAHSAGIVHRDLKPANVFLVSNDDEELAKLFDFGIAKSLRDAKLASRDRTLPGVPVGTPYYMSPEQVEGATTVDHRADIWALGVIAFECLLGRRPFEMSTVAGLLLAIREGPVPTPSLSGSVPAGFDAWFARACARDPGGRYQSAKQAADDLRRLCERTSASRADPQASETLLSHSASRPFFSHRSHAPSPRRAWLVGAALGLCVGGLGLLLAKFAFDPTATPLPDTSATGHRALIVSTSGAVTATRPALAPSLGADEPNPSAPQPEVIPVPEAGPRVEVAPAPQRPRMEVPPRSASGTEAPKPPRQTGPARPRAAAPLPTSAPDARRRSPSVAASAAPRPSVDLGI